MNVIGNILIIWQGWKPNLQTSTFWHTISLSLPALPPLYPLVSSSHLTPFVSQGPIKSPLPHPLVHLSLKCHLHFSVHILGLELPVDGLIFLALAATSTAHCVVFPAQAQTRLMVNSIQGRMRPVCVCVCNSGLVYNKILLWLISYLVFFWTPVMWWQFNNCTIFESFQS